MRYKKLFLVLAIATLSLTACKKEETPAPETTLEETTTNETETEVETESENITAEETVAEEIEEATENLVEEEVTVENAETTEPTENDAEEVVDGAASETTETSEGTPFEEGEYVEPSVQEMQNISEHDARMQQFNEDMKFLYEAGLISEEEYKDAIEYEPDISLQGSETYTPSISDEEFAKQYEENAAKARENDSSSLPLSDTRTDINYDIELPEYLKGR